MDGALTRSRTMNALSPVRSLLCSVTLDLTDGAHSCVATGSAYVDNKNMTADQHNEYRFAIARSKHPATDQPGELLIDVVQNEKVAALDLKHQPVTGVQHFDNVAAGKRNFFWLGRKVTTDPATDNINAEHFAMGVVCTGGK